MRGEAAVGIHHQLASGESGVRFKTALDKSTGWIDQHFGMFVQRKFLHGGSDHMAQDVPAQFRQGQFLLMLAGYHHCGNAARDSRAVFHRHLRLAVRTQAGDDALPAGIGQQAGQSMGQHHRQRQQLLCFIAGKAVQDSLISCAGLRAAAHSFRNVGTLLMGDDLHLIVAAAVSGFPHRSANNGRDIRNLRCRDLACGDDLSGCGHDLAGNAGSGVLRKTGIYHRVRDGVAELVGMSLGD